MLAYIFWHWPRPGIASDEYVARQRAFHQALAARGPKRCGRHTSGVSLARRGRLYLSPTKTGICWRAAPDLTRSTPPPSPIHCVKRMTPPQASPLAVWRRSSPQRGRASA